MPSPDIQEIQTKVKNFCVEAPLVTLVPGGEEYHFLTFHGQVANVIHAIMDLGEFDPSLGTQAATLYNKVRNNFNLLIHVGGGEKFDLAAIKQCGINFRTIAGDCSALATSWEAAKGKILCNSEDVNEMLAKAADKQVGRFKKRVSGKTERLVKPLLQAQDPIAAASEKVNIIEDATATLQDAAMKIKLEKLQTASDKLQKMADVFTSLGERYDREVLPDLERIRKIGGGQDPAQSSTPG